MVRSRGVDSIRRSKAFKCAKIANEANFTAQNRKNHLKMKAESVIIKIATDKG